MAAVRLYHKAAVRLSQKAPLGWPYDEACEKLIEMFDLVDKAAEEKKRHGVNSSSIWEAAKASIKSASDSNNIPWHRFDIALRSFAQQQEVVSGLIPTHKLDRVLLHYYLEIQGVDLSLIETVLPDTATAKQFLDELESPGLISAHTSRRALFYTIVESCTVPTDELMSAHKFDLSKALRAGLQNAIFTRSQADVAECCLLTGVTPSVARSHEADKDLSAAVLSILTTKGTRSPMHRTVKSIAAKSFPLKFDERVVEDAILQYTSISGWIGGDDVYDQAREKYLAELFRQETLCFDSEQAITFLEANAWEVEKAIQSYRKKALTPVEVDPLNMDDRTVDAIQTLVQRYDSSRPTNRPKDYVLTDLIRRFQSGDLHNNATALESLHAKLTYRLRVTSLAMEIVQGMGLWKGAAVSIWDWDPHESAGASYQARMRITGQLQQNTGWFKPKKTGDGWYCAKPLWYVARALDMQGLGGEEVLRWIEEAKRTFG
jgi:hypothetical protein